MVPQKSFDIATKMKLLDDIRFQIFLMSNLLYSKCRATLCVEFVARCFDPYKEFHDDALRG